MKTDERYGVLLVEDDEVDREKVRRFLQDSSEVTYTIKEALTLAAAKEVVVAGDIDCVLLDLNLPDGNGMELLDGLKEFSAEPPAIIVLTRMSEQELGTAAVAAGAQDYLEKGSLTAELLHRAIRYAVGRNRFGREQLALMKELREAQNNVKQLKGLLPICAACHQVRDDQGYWQEIEKYLQVHSDMGFTHGLCPKCREELYPRIKLEDEDGPSSVGEGAPTD